jgi:hypothetical protein
LKLFRGALLAVVVLALLLAIDPKTLAKSFRQLDPATIAAAVALDLIFYAVECLRLTLLSSGRFSFVLNFRARLLSALLGNAMPGMAAAEGIRLLLLDAPKPGRKFYILLMLAANRVYVLLSLVTAVGALTLLAPTSELPPIIHEHRGVLALAVLAIFLPLLFRLRLLRRLSIALTLRAPPRIARILRTTHVAMLAFSRPLPWLHAAWTSLLATILAIALYWLVARGAGIDGSPFYWAIWMPVVILSTFLPIGFGAVGSQELGFALMSRTTGTPLERLLTMSIALHSVRILASVPGILFLTDLRAAGIAGLKAARSWRPAPSRLRAKASPSSRE